MENLSRRAQPIECFQWGVPFTVSFASLVWHALPGGPWQVLSNVLLYLPLGLLLPLVWKRASWWRVTAAGLALSLVTELVQPVVGRSFDVDDLIANTLGALAGYGVFALVRLAAPRAVARCRSGAKRRTAEPSE